MSKKWLEIVVKWLNKRGTLYFCQNIAFNFRLSSCYSLNFIQFYNARQKKDPNIIPVLANKSQEIDGKNHFKKLEKKINYKTGNRKVGKMKRLYRKTNVNIRPKYCSTYKNFKEIKSNRKWEKRKDERISLSTFCFSCITEKKKGLNTYSKWSDVWKKIT